MLPLNDPHRKYTVCQDRNGTAFPQVCGAAIYSCPGSPGHVKVQFDIGGLEILVAFSCSLGFRGFLLAHPKLRTNKSGSTVFFVLEMGYWMECSLLMDKQRAFGIAAEME